MIHEIKTKPIKEHKYPIHISIQIDQKSQLTELITDPICEDEMRKKVKLASKEADLKENRWENIPTTLDPPEPSVMDDVVGSIEEKTRRGRRG